MAKFEEMSARLNCVNDVQELKNIILQQAQEIDKLAKYSDRYLDQLSENMRLQVKLAEAEFSAYMHKQYARAALELARKNKKEANVID